MSGHIDESRLNEYLERLLSPEKVREVEEHLEACAECQERLSAQSELVVALRDLPREARPDRELWEGIAGRLGSASGAQRGAVAAGARVIPLEARRSLGQRITLSVGQLLAAGVVLALISGASVWWALGEGGGGAPLASSEPGGIPAIATSDALEEYDQAAADLEELLEEGRDVLAPSTVQVLEESLETIERAIEETRAALARDPGSSILNQRLADTMRRRLEILRQAARAIYAQT
jgi:anti-sigma factor RsiW